MTDSAPTMRVKRNILVVYAHVIHPMRATIAQLLHAFHDYSQDNVYLLNLVHQPVPWYVHTVEFDLIIFHTLFMTAIWGGPDHFRKMMRKAAPLKRSLAVKAIMPQDEFMYSALLCEFVNEFDIDWVFSVAPEGEWPKLYPTVDFERVRFCRILPGYLDEKELPGMIAAGLSLDHRSIDICYRLAAKPRFVWGRQGLLKQQIADAFLARAPSRGLSVDISTRGEDTILGDAWYGFLGRCKYTLGVESGASLIDPDGSIESKVSQYVGAHADAEFSDVEEACFPGLDGNTNLVAISPRHLEACATRTCQVLTEGEYNGILRPWEHYIPVKRDFSNVEEVLDLLVDDRLRSQIVARAFDDVVASGRFSYREFVRLVVQRSLDSRPPTERPHWKLFWYGTVRGLMWTADSGEWLLIRWLLAPIVRPLRFRLLPRLVAWIKNRRYLLLA